MYGHMTNEEVENRTKEMQWLGNFTPREKKKILSTVDHADDVLLAQRFYHKHDRDPWVLIKFSFNGKGCATRIPLRTGNKNRR